MTSSRKYDLSRHALELGQARQETQGRFRRLTEEEVSAEWRQTQQLQAQLQQQQSSPKPPRSSPRPPRSSPRPPRTSPPAPRPQAPPPVPPHASPPVPRTPGVEDLSTVPLEPPPPPRQQPAPHPVPPSPPAQRGEESPPPVPPLPPGLLHQHNQSPAATAATVAAAPDRGASPPPRHDPPPPPERDPRADSPSPPPRPLPRAATPENSVEHPSPPGQPPHLNGSVSPLTSPVLGREATPELPEPLPDYDLEPPLGGACPPPRPAPHRLSPRPDLQQQPPPVYENVEAGLDGFYQQDVVDTARPPAPQPPQPGPDLGEARLAPKATASSIPVPASRYEKRGKEKKGKEKELKDAKTPKLVKEASPKKEVLQQKERGKQKEKGKEKEKEKSKEKGKEKGKEKEKKQKKKKGEGGREAEEEDEPPPRPPRVPLGDRTTPSGGSASSSSSSAASATEPPASLLATPPAPPPATTSTTSSSGSGSKSRLWKHGSRVPGAQPKSPTAPDPQQATSPKSWRNSRLLGKIVSSSKLGSSRQPASAGKAGEERKGRKGGAAGGEAGKGADTWPRLGQRAAAPPPGQQGGQEEGAPSLPVRDRSASGSKVKVRSGTSSSSSLDRKALGRPGVVMATGEGDPQVAYFGPLTLQSRGELESVHGKTILPDPSLPGDYTEEFTDNRELRIAAQHPGFTCQAANQRGEDTAGAAPCSLVTFRPDQPLTSFLTSPLAPQKPRAHQALARVSGPALSVAMATQAAQGDVMTATAPSEQSSDVNGSPAALPAPRGEEGGGEGQESQGGSAAPLTPLNGCRPGQEGERGQQQQQQQEGAGSLAGETGQGREVDGQDGERQQEKEKEKQEKQEQQQAAAMKEEDKSSPGTLHPGPEENHVSTSPSSSPSPASSTDNGMSPRVPPHTPPASRGVQAALEASAPSPLCFSPSVAPHRPPSPQTNGPSPGAGGRRAEWGGPGKEERPLPAQNSPLLGGSAGMVTSNGFSGHQVSRESLRAAMLEEEHDVSSGEMAASCCLEGGLPPQGPQTPQHFVVVAIDFGTTYSGYAFSFTKDPDSVYMMRKWAGEEPGLINQKTPTSLLLTPDGEFHSFGFTARNHFHSLEAEESRSWLYFEKFKMALHHKADLSKDTLLTAVNGRTWPALDVFAHALRYFKEHALQQLSEQSGFSILNEDLRWVITVPAIWKAPAKQFMRQAAYQAGLVSPEHPGQLLIALEPEAASIYCRRLRIHQLVPETYVRRPLQSPSRSVPEQLDLSPAVSEQSIEMTALSPPIDLPPNQMLESEIKGTRYMVVDCGGGTVDVTVHELDSQGRLLELHRATGGPHGALGVDEEFERLLCAILGADFVSAYKSKFPLGWVGLMAEFESRKRSASPHRASLLNVALPFSLIDSFRKHKGSHIEGAIRRYGSSEVTWSPQGMLRLTPEAMRALFAPTLARIRQAIGDVINHPQARSLQYMFLVGGFAESPILQHDLRREFSPFVKVLIPQEVSLAILKGAVLFGLDPKVVNLRRSRLTYGVGVLNQFDPERHPPSKLVRRGGRAWCTDVLDRFVVVDQPVLLGDCVRRSYTPVKPGQDRIVLNVYCSERSDVEFITDPGVRKCGTLILDLSEGQGQSDKSEAPPPELGLRKIQVFVSFGDTEIALRAKDLATGRCVQAAIDFLNK